MATTYIRQLGTPMSIIIAGALIAAAILMTNHWEIVPTGFTALRLNRWSGSVVACRTDRVPFAGVQLECSEVQIGNR
jgi:hypothetical protein